MTVRVYDDYGDNFLEFLPSTDSIRIELGDTDDPVNASAIEISYSEFDRIVSILKIEQRFLTGVINKGE